MLFFFTYDPALWQTLICNGGVENKDFQQNLEVSRSFLISFSLFFRPYLSRLSLDSQFYQLLVWVSMFRIWRHMYMLISASLKEDFS